VASNLDATELDSQSLEDDEPPLHLVTKKGGGLRLMMVTEILPVKETEEEKKAKEKADVLLNLKAKLSSMMLNYS